METTPRFNYTRNATQGEKYLETQNLSTTEIAKLIRSEIRSKFPTVKASIRTQYFSGGSSIDITFTKLPFNPINPEFNPNDYSYNMQKSRYTHEYQELERVCKNIANQYNFDDSDSMIDYFHTNFYLHVSIDWQYEKELIANAKNI